MGLAAGLLGSLWLAPSPQPRRGGPGEARQKVWDPLCSHPGFGDTGTPSLQEAEGQAVSLVMPRPGSSLAVSSSQAEVCPAP